ERIVLPTFDPNAAAPSLERIDSARDVLEALLGTAMNLPWVQEPGWVTLCQLAEQVPAYRLRYPDAVAAANVLN
ncbi:MAG: hypothetical protein KDA95_07995, partial [Acidimicrobiales bacterium]|nr:hypothetical protein [Acidimicrobiales bacterium]